MFFRQKKRVHERYYLLPGQGGRSYHRKQQRLIGWSVLVALVFGAILAAAMWWLSRPKL